MTSDIDTRPPETEHDISTLARLARTCVRHRWIVIIGWVAALFLINGISGAVGPDYRTDFTLPASETKEVQELLEANSPDRAGFASQIVFRAPHERQPHELDVVSVTCGPVEVAQVLVGQ